MVMVARRTSEETTGRALLEQLEQEWCAALCRKDMQKLGSLAHEEFLLLGSRARVPFALNRQQWLDAVAAHAFEHVAIEARDAVQLDRVIIGTVEAQWRIRSCGRLIEDHVLMTSVWVKDAATWQTVRRHSTPAGQTNVRA